MEIIQKNTADQIHGYYEDKERKCHFYDAQKIGYESLIAENCGWQCHYIDWNEIGCEQMNNYQYFFNKPGKKFGEQIKWK